MSKPAAEVAREKPRARPDQDSLGQSTTTQHSTQPHSTRSAQHQISTAHSTRAASSRTEHQSIRVSEQCRSSTEHSDEVDKSGTRKQGGTRAERSGAIANRVG